MKVQQERDWPAFSNKMEWESGHNVRDGYQSRIPRIPIYSSHPPKDPSFYGKFESSPTKFVRRIVRSDSSRGPSDVRALGKMHIHLYHFELPLS
jgi:hypothetical protein